MEFEELYQEVILDHAGHPRNFGEMPDADAHVHGDNPMCGDEITVHLKRDGERIAALTFTGAGCSICMASASLMTQKAKARTESEARALSRNFQNLLTAEELPPGGMHLGDLQALAGVRKFPLRVKCATLAWHALEKALDGAGAEQSFHVRPDTAAE